MTQGTAKPGRAQSWSEAERASQSAWCIFAMESSDLRTKENERIH